MTRDEALKRCADLSDALCNSATVYRAVLRFGKPDATERARAHFIAVADELGRVIDAVKAPQSEEIAA